jgi:hypothetical protein
MKPARSSWLARVRALVGGRPLRACRRRWLHSSGWPHERREAGRIAQHGPGKKHERPIVLSPWQYSLVRERPDLPRNPGDLLRCLRTVRRALHRVRRQDDLRLARLTSRCSSSSWARSAETRPPSGRSCVSCPKPPSQRERMVEAIPSGLPPPAAHLSHRRRCSRRRR